jgi:hypothetical protein
MIVNSPTPQGTITLNNKVIISARDSDGVRDAHTLGGCNKISGACAIAQQRKVATPRPDSAITLERHHTSFACRDGFDIHQSVYHDWRTHD